MHACPILCLLFGGLRPTYVAAPLRPPICVYGQVSFVSITVPFAQATKHEAFLFLQVLLSGEHLLMLSV